MLLKTKYISHNYTCLKTFWYLTAGNTKNTSFVISQSIKKLTSEIHVKENYY